jgi:type IV pilus assembly protein PilC
MPIKYDYQGFNKSGEKVKGSIQAQDEDELKAKLRTRGIRGIRLIVANKGAVVKKFSGTVPGEILLIFTRQLHVLLQSGIPIVQSLDLLHNQMQPASKNMASVIQVIQNQVQEGQFLWESIAQFPKIFPKLYISLIRSGESSGQLDNSLERLVKYIEESEKLKKILKSASIYPIAVISIAIGIITVMLVFVIPKFKELFGESGQTLPAPTQFLIDISEFIIKNYIFILAGVFGGSFLFMKYVKSETGKHHLQKFFFKVPLFGDILQKGSVARFSRTMNALLSSGVNILDALEICQNTIDNIVVEEDIKKIRPDIEQGKSLGESVQKLKSLPIMATQMIAIGEQTGSIDKMLDKVASFYELEVENLVSGLTKLIEPIMIVVLGGIVGGILVAMYLPIFKLASTMM